MKYLNTYRIFESKKETEDIIKDVFSKLPKGFYYRVKYGSKSSSDRDIAHSLGEHPNLDFSIVRITDDEQAKIWSVDKREIKSKYFDFFTFSDISKVLDELFDKLTNYSKIGDYTGKTGGYSFTGDKDFLRGREFLNLSFVMRCKLVPQFRGVKSQVDNEIGDLFSDVFDVWVPDMNIKESGDFYKISSIISNMSPYQIPPMTDSIKSDFIDSINRFEVAMDCNLISTVLSYRDYDKPQEYSDQKFTVHDKRFNSINSKEAVFEFIKNNEIIGFTIIFKKR